MNENANMVKTLQKLLKLNDENNNNKLFNEIKNYQNIPEKEMEIQNQRFYEIQAFIEANKQKIEQVEKYDELLKENLALKTENENLRKSSEYLQENKNINDLIVILKINL
jgi:predicted phage gp36 major capsid-like protein